VDQFAESAAAFADSARAAIAFMRATRDGRDEDAELIVRGINPYRLALQIANVACHQDLTDEFLDLELELINRADACGQLERFARENNILLNPGKEEKPPAEWAHLSIAGIIGETPAGTAVGTVVNCGTCKQLEVCCQGTGTCIIIRHPEKAIVQHITAEEARNLIILLLIAAGKAI
jgi:hypothetical protein